jgi:hypothetical protein
MSSSSVSISMDNHNKQKIIACLIIMGSLFLIHKIDNALFKENIINSKSIAVISKAVFDLLNKKQFDKMENSSIIKFKAPFRIVIGGPSGSGKTSFVTQFLNNLDVMVDAKINHIFWFYAEFQNWFNNFPNIKFIKGIPKMEDFESKQNSLIILDDLFQFLNKNLTQLFTCNSHHMNISVIFITQNIFHKGTEHRNITLNATHLIIFKNPRDKSQIMHLARQMYPSNAAALVEAFRDATKQPYSYLLIDLTPDVIDDMRLRAKIFPGEYTVIYKPKF